MLENADYIILSFDENMKNCKNLKENISEADNFKVFINFIEKLQNIKIAVVKNVPGLNYEELKNHVLNNKYPERIIVSFRANLKFRVYGYFIDNIFKIVKLDKNHKNT